MIVSFIYDSGPLAGETRKGIYRWEKDKLVICVYALPMPFLLVELALPGQFGIEQCIILGGGHALRGFRPAGAGRL